MNSPTFSSDHARKVTVNLCKLEFKRRKRLLTVYSETCLGAGAYTCFQFAYTVKPLLSGHPQEIAN